MPKFSPHRRSRLLAVLGCAVALAVVVVTAPAARAQFAPPDMSNSSSYAWAEIAETVGGYLDPPQVDQYDTGTGSATATVEIAPYYCAPLGEEIGPLYNSATCGCTVSDGGYVLTGSGGMHTVVPIEGNYVFSQGRAIFSYQQVFSSPMLLHFTGTIFTTPEYFGGAYGGPHLAVGNGLTGLSMDGQSAGPTSIDLLVSPGDLVTITAAAADQEAYGIYGDGLRSTWSFTATLSPVPEPGALTLLGSALVGLGGVLFLRRRRAKS